MALRIGPGGPWLVTPEQSPSEATQVPFSRNWLPHTLASWTLVPVLLWTNGFTNEAGADAPPPLERPWVETVRQAWDTPAAIQQARRFLVQPTASVADAPPPVDRPWTETVRQAWDRPAEIQSVRRFVVQPTTTGSDAVLVDPTYASLMSLWLPAETPAVQKRLGQIVSAAAADAPPLLSREWLAPVLQRWEPELASAPARSRAPIPTPDNPPFGAKRQSLDAWQTDPPRAFARVLQPPPTPDLPPFGVRPTLPTIRDAWQLDGPAIQKRVVLVPQVAAQADNPPAGARNWLIGVVATWSIEPPLVKPPARVAQGAPSDDPPFGAKPWINTLTAWAPESGLLPPRRFTVQTATADNPPFGAKRQSLEAWQPEAPRTFVRVLTPPPTPDLPPFGLRPNLPTLRDAWSSEPAAQQKPARFVQAAIEPTPRGPAPWLQKVVDAWQPIAQQPVRPRITPPIPPAVVNNPPFTMQLRWKQMASVVSLWERDPPWPSARFIVASSGPIPPTALDRIIFIRADDRVIAIVDERTIIIADDDRTISFH